MSISHDELRIDIPVELTEVKAAFGVASLSFEGDLPAAIFHIGLVVSDASSWGITPDVVAVFHTNAGHVVLDDEPYNQDRNISTGNPYKALIVDMMAKGVRVELCGATARAHGWRNSQTIAGVKINTDAMARLTQLAQNGYVWIAEA
jgi:intracellular sulfur oxidation DsrE/DsrF family protein